MSKSHLELIEHILAEIEFLRKQRDNLNETEFAVNEVMQRAFVRSLEIIGEAVKGVAGDIKEKYPEIDWKALAGMRDKLIHHYFGVDYTLVWDVVENKIDKLKYDLEKVKNSEQSTMNNQQ